MNRNSLTTREGDWKLIPFRASVNNENYPEVGKLDSFEILKMIHMNQ